MILIPAFMFLKPAQATTGIWQITVQTDRSNYHIGDTVIVNGTLTYNYGGQQSVQVTITVKMPSGTYPTITTTTGYYGNYSATFTLGGSTAALGTWTVTAAYGTVKNQTTFLVEDICITAGGNVEPSDAPISRNGNIYNLTANILGSANGDGIIIQRNNIILDGGDHTLNGMYGSTNGINLASVNNVTVENISIESFQYGLYQYLCPSCSIVDTNLFFNSYGIYYRQAYSSTIEGNNITQNSLAGILLDGSYDNSISSNSLANTVSSNFGAISLRGSSYGNNIIGNTFANNTLYGVYIEASYDNFIFHNNFLNNKYQGFVTSDSSGNVWNNSYPSGGNYWDDYKGVDLKSGPNQDQPGSDGIGDIPYIIDSTNRDHYPLMNVWVAPETDATNIETKYPATIIATNATVTYINSTNPDYLNFNVTGTHGTNGSMLIIVPLGLNSTSLKVYVNGKGLTSPPPTISTNGTHYFIYCQLSFSTLQIVIPFVVPVIPLGTLTATILMIAILGAYSSRKKKTPS